MVGGGLGLINGDEVSCASQLLCSLNEAQLRTEILTSALAGLMLGGSNRPLAGTQALKLPR